MATNIIRIKNLDPEHNLNDIIIPVDKAGYTSNAKRIGISGLTNYVLSGFTGQTMIYSYSGTTTVSVGGIPSGVYITGMTIQHIFDWMFYSGVPPTTTTTTTVGATTTTTTVGTTTTTTTAGSTTTTTQAPTTTTTTTILSNYHLVNVSIPGISGVTVTDIEVAGISISTGGAVFPSLPNPDPSFSTDGTSSSYGTVAIDIYYTYIDVNQNIMINTTIDGTICNIVTVGTPSGGGYVLSVNLNITPGEYVNIYCWPGNCF